MLRDDGAIVYLNGTEVFRTNMPTGAVTAATFASALVLDANERTYVTVAVNPARLVAGTNLLAVEIHQSNATSSDISFNLELTSAAAVTVTRGPYLQLGTPSSTVVRWRTSAPVIGRVQYGQSAGAQTWAAQESTATTEHAVTLTGLLPNTTYYYSVGTDSAVLAGGDATHFFLTPPVAGTATATRVWVLGDSGTANANARAVRDAYYAFTGARHTNLWLMLGDNAYANGTDAEYQAAVFDVFPTMLRKSVLWSTLGNHDGFSADSASQTGPYYNIFTLPKAGEAGGLASGTEAYYSFDYANIHFISLESFETNRSATGPMLTWLRNDLASTNQPWIVAFFHHPPYSKGSHDSDTEIELREMRQNALPILENAGVDLVLSGHSHSYERSFLIDGHYGTSGTFTSALTKDGGSGREDGAGPYRKPTYGMAAHEGAVYAVAGSSGQATGGALNHPAMFLSLNSLGSLVLDVNGNRLDATFLDQAGVRRDYFTIVKGPGAGTPASTTIELGSAADTRLEQKAPDSIYSGDTTLWAAGNSNGACAVAETALRFNLSGLPAGSTVTDAKLKLYLTNTSVAGQFQVYSLKRNWSEAAATWRHWIAGSLWSAPGANRVPQDRGRVPRASFTGTPNTTGYALFALNSDGIRQVQEWVDDVLPNYGFLVRPTLASPCSNARDDIAFQSREGANPPKLVITYH